MPSKDCDEVKTLRPRQCRKCNARLKGKDPEPLRHQVIELPEIKPIVTEYQQHLNCNKRLIGMCKELYKQRMGWGFEWVSSFNNEFNRDFGVTFTEEKKAEGRMNYNYRLGSFPVTECPGVSSFARNEAGEVFHTYSAYARGLENLPGIYSLLDLVPKGRGESDLPYGMAWVRYHDRYKDDSFVDPCA